LKSNYNAEFVDTITEPGPCKIIAENKDINAVNSILQRVKISVNVHKSNLIAISGHYDCAGNPCEAEVQKGQTKKSVEYFKNLYPNTEIIGLWIDHNWEVHSL
jgi:carbonic anhydrase